MIPAFLIGFAVGFFLGWRDCARAAASRASKVRR